MTIAELLNKEIKEAANQFEECKQVAESLSTLNDLKKLRKFTQDRKAWSKFSKLLSQSARISRSKSPQGRSTSFLTTHQRVSQRLEPIKKPYASFSMLFLYSLSSSGRVFLI